MAQLIATTDLESIKLLCRQGSIEKSYAEKYEFLKKYFQPETYKLFARPEFRSNKKVNWYTELEGKIYPFSKADEVIDSFMNFIENQITNLYTLAINSVQDLEEKKHIISELDRLLTIQNIDDVYLVISDDNTRSLCITNWCQDEKKQVNPIAGLFNPKAVNVILTIKRGIEPVADYEIWISIGDEEFKYVTNEHGRIELPNLELLSQFTVIQKSEGKIIKKQTFVVDRQMFEFSLRSERGAKVQIKAIDRQDQPLANIKLEVEVNGKKEEFSTDNQGVIVLGEVDYGSQITVEQKISEARKITKTFVFDKGTPLPLIFKGDKSIGSYLVIKVLDSNNQPFANAEIEILLGERKIIKTTNKEGIMVISDLVPTEKLVVRHLVNGRPVSQRTIEYNKDESEIIFRSHVAQRILKNVSIRLMESKEYPIMNLSVKLVTDSDWQFSVTDQRGYALFEDVDCNANPRIEFTFRRKTYTFPIECKEQTNFEFTLSGKKKVVVKKTLWYLIILGVIIILGAIGALLLKTRSATKAKEETSALLDTIQQQLVEKKFEPYHSRVYVLNAHDRFPVEDVTVYLLTDSLQHELRYDSGYFVVDVHSDKQMDFELYIGKKDTVRKSFVPRESDTIWVKKSDLKIAHDTTCGISLYQRGVHTYIQTFRFPSKRERVHFRFRKMFHSDLVRVYVGPKEKISPERLVYQMKVFSDTARFIINLPYPDSLITFEIEAGEPNFPAWTLSVPCK